MISIKKAKQIAKKNLTEKRYYHTLCVYKLAVKLAQIHGESQEKAAIAALFHDIAKEMSKEKILKLFNENGIIKYEVDNHPFAVWHALAGSIIAQYDYGIDDEDILSAIECHSTGKENMTLLDKIIYIADVASEDRQYSSADKIRKDAQVNLDKALIDALSESIAMLKRENKKIDEQSIKAYISLRKNYYGGV